MKRVINGYSTKKKTQTLLYSRKLTLRNLHRVPEFLDEAKKVAERERKNYDIVTGPGFKDSTIEVYGVTEASGTVPGLGGAFDYYEIGEALFTEDGLLNRAVSADVLRSYIYYSETRSPLRRKRTAAEPYFLDCFDGIAYYFCFEPDRETVISASSLGKIITEAGKGERYVIYADSCLLSDQKLKRLGMIFKKIPRGIRKF